MHEAQGRRQLADQSVECLPDSEPSHSANYTSRAQLSNNQAFGGKMKTAQEENANKIRGTVNQVTKWLATLLKTCVLLGSLSTRAVLNILFVFYSVRIIGRIVYSYSAE